MVLNVSCYLATYDVDGMTETVPLEFNNVGYLVREREEKDSPIISWATAGGQFHSLVGIIDRTPLWTRLYSYDLMVGGSSGARRVMIDY